MSKAKPPVAKGGATPSKRKETEAPSPLGDDEPPRTTALDLFRAKMQKPTQLTRTIRTAGSAVPTVTLEGIVLRAKTVQHAGKKPGTTVPKLEVTLDVHRVRHNGAPDVICTGVLGLNFILPTRKPTTTGAGGRDGDDDSPEGGGGGSGGKREAAPPRALALTLHHKAINVSFIPRVSFYTTTPGKGEAKAGADLIQAGMPVEVTGVVANLSADGSQLWLNAQNCIPKLDGIIPCEVAKQTMDYLTRPEVMASAAVRLSLTMHGFFGTSLNPEHEAQATVFREQWVAARNGAVAACEARAMQIRAEQGVDGESTAVVLDDHASRLRATQPSDLAFGAPFFPPAVPVTPDRPLYHATIVHRIESMEYPQHPLLSGLFDDASSGRLPNTYVVPSVIETEVQGATLNVKCKLTFIGSKTAALHSIREFKDPTLDSGDFAALGVKFNMRELPTVTGVLHAAKAADICQNVFRYGAWAAAVGVTPRDPSDQSVSCPFNSSNQIDMIRTLPNIGVLVSEKFVIDNLAGGASQYVFESDGAAMLQDKEGNPLSVPTPQLRTHGYQEISGSSFKFALSKTPADKPSKLYRVWHKDACTAIARNTDLLVNSEEGEKSLVEASAALKEQLSDFLITFCAVYCVAY